MWCSCRCEISSLCHMFYIPNGLFWATELNTFNRGSIHSRSDVASRLTWENSKNKKLREYLHCFVNDTFHVLCAVRCALCTLNNCKLFLWYARFGALSQYVGQHDVYTQVNLSSNVFAWNKFILNYRFVCSIYSLRILLKVIADIRWLPNESFLFCFFLCFPVWMIYSFLINLLLRIRLFVQISYMFSKCCFSVGAISSDFILVR